MTFRAQRPTINGETAADLLPILKQQESGKTGGLKELAAKIGFPRLRETPHPFNQPLGRDNAIEALAYNQNDLEATLAVAKVAEPLIEMRVALQREYNNKRILNKPNASLAEALIAQALFGDGRWEKPSATTFTLNCRDVAERFHFNDPALSTFRDRLCQTTLTWTVEEAEGQKTLTKPDYADEVVVDGVTYTPGKGGLHSVDAPAIFESCDKYALWDMDAEAAYPSTILKDQLAPSHLPKFPFLHVYRKLRERRIESKKAGNIALSNGLKQAVNGAFGKGGSVHSFMFDPATMTRCTLAMQLTLLQFVDFLNIPEIDVVSCNTDGLLLRLPRQHVEAIRALTNTYANSLGFDLDWTEFQRYCRRDVNSYVALTADGTVKAKGAYLFDRTSWQSLSKKTATQEGIVTLAAQRALLYGEDVEPIIRDCQDVSLFTDYTSVDRKWALAVDGIQIGRIARYYRALPGQGTDLKKVRLATGKANKLADCVVLVEDLPDHRPDDLDLDWYIAKARAKVTDITDPEVKTRTTIPIGELGTAQRERLTACQSLATVDPMICSTFALGRFQDDWNTVRKGNRQATMLDILRRAWVAGNGQVTAGDLLWLGEQVTEGDTYFAGQNHAKLVALVEWVVRRVSPFRIPQTPQEIAERALEWAQEHVEPLKRKRKMVHTGVLASTFINGEALRRYAKIKDQYRLATSIAAVAVKNTHDLSPNELVALIEEVDDYFKRTPSDDPVS
jgi:hypothetical protein